MAYKINIEKEVILQCKEQLEAITFEYCMGGRTKKETIADKEILLWILKFQNPLCMNKIKTQLKGKIEIKVLGPSVSVDIL